MKERKILLYIALITWLLGAYFEAKQAHLLVYTGFYSISFGLSGYLIGSAISYRRAEKKSKENNEK